MIPMNCVTIYESIKQTFMHSSSVFRGIVLQLILLFASVTTYAQLAIPPLDNRRVHDDAGVLSPQTVQTLEMQLKLHEDSTGNQIAILIINSLNGEAIEDYSLRVAEQWKLGKEKNDNGVLLLIAKEDRKMRIEVGQGLEGVLTDALSNQIIRNEMVPKFRQENYDGGVLLAVNSIVQAIAGEYVAGAADNVGSGMGITERIFTGLFIFGILGIFTLAGLSAKGGSSWFLYVFLIPFYALFPHVVAGFYGGVAIFLTYLIGYPILRTIFKRKGWLSKGNGSSGGNRGGWSSGSGWFSGGGGSSWGGGGGGFSGGGGSFGGGGSSGSW